MALLTNSSSIVLWQEAVKCAEKHCEISLKEDLEAYLVSLLIRYTNHPEVVKQIFAEAFLEALQLRERERHYSLQHVGDQCLLFAGLFPRLAERRHVKLSYFVELGRSAYATISRKTNDVYSSLSMQFVTLMDVLQSLRQPPMLLLPLEAYELWESVGSQRALRILQEYTQGTPYKSRF